MLYSSAMRTAPPTPAESPEPVAVAFPLLVAATRAPSAAQLAPASELETLRGGLRSRESITHLAKAWTSSLIFLVLCGIWMKLRADSLGRPLFLWPGALLCISMGLLAVREGWRGLRLLGGERSRLRRLRELEALSPPPRELF